MPDKQYSSNSYRYGFNGKENDNEVKGNGNSLDFESRIYDSRLGRWLSLDPLWKSFPHQSPYQSFVNNPIAMVDITGENNTIYLVLLPSGNAKLTREDMDDIASEIKSNLNKLGLNTNVVVFRGPGEFNPTWLDKTDSYALIGSVEEIKLKFNEPNFKNSMQRSSYVSETIPGWEGGVTNPEVSEVNGSAIAIDVDALKGDEYYFETDKKKVAAFLITHGAGHNANIRHDDLEAAGTFMMSGGYVVSGIKQDNPEYHSTLGNPINNPDYKKLDDFFGARAKELKGSFLKKYGSDTPRDSHYERYRNANNQRPVNKGQY